MNNMEEPTTKEILKVLNHLVNVWKTYTTIEYLLDRYNELNSQNKPIKKSKKGWGRSYGY